jgi:hypothetical protein
MMPFMAPTQTEASGQSLRQPQSVEAKDGPFIK